MTKREREAYEAAVEACELFNKAERHWEKDDGDMTFGDCIDQLGVPAAVHKAIKLVKDLWKDF